MSAIKRPLGSISPPDDAGPPSAARAAGSAQWSEWQRGRLEGIEAGLAGSHPLDRQALLTALGGAIRESIATGHPAAAILLDLNNFTDINGAWGPAVGDEVLQATGERISRFAAGQLAGIASGTAVASGRLDADHFIVVMPSVANIEGLSVAAAELLRAVAQPLALSGQSIALSARAAIVHIPVHGRTVASVLGRGFRLLNSAARASATGMAASESTVGLDLSTVTLERDLVGALRTDQLFVALQPKVDTATRALRGAEALVRWHHPERGWVAPPVFIEAAEKSGLIFELGLRILTDACRAATMLAGRGAKLSIAVNVSVHQLAHPDFLSRFLEVIDREGVEPQKMEIEVTESAAMMGGERVLGSLQALRRCGIGVAIDDFGTGFSNLAALGALPADTLKIDRSLVVGIDNGERASALLAIAVQLGRTFGLATVAEGVETQAQFDRVAELGCDMVQGYFTGRPVAAAEFADRYLNA